MSDVERGWWALRLRVLWRVLVVSLGWVRWKYRRRRWLRRPPARRSIMLAIHIAGLAAGGAAVWTAAGIVGGLAAIAMGCFVLEWRVKNA